MHTSNLRTERLLPIFTGVESVFTHIKNTFEIMLTKIELTLNPTFFFL